MTIRLERQVNTTPRAVEAGEIASFSVSAGDRRRLTLYTGQSGEFPVNNLPGVTILWGPKAFSAAEDVKAIQQSYPESVGRTPIGLPAEVRYIEVGYSSWKQIAGISPNSDDLPEQVSNLQGRLANGARLKYILVGSSDGSSLPTLFIGRSILDHKEILGSRDPKMFLMQDIFTLRKEKMVSMK